MEFEFADERRYDSKSPKNILQMYKLFGVNENNKCRNCQYLNRYEYKIDDITVNRKNYYSCSKYLVANSVKLNWRLKNMSCGLFKERENNE